MRTITAGLFISLDGVVAEPQEWHFPYFNDEMGEAVGAQLATADTLLMGRRTYETFAAAWPARERVSGEEGVMAKSLGDARKIVVSHRRLEFGWRNSEQLRGDLVSGVTALKNEPGETPIGMSGSPSIVRQLLEAGLIDEMHLLVHPIALQHGFRLFDEGNPIALELLSATPFKTGVVHLVYGPGELRDPLGYDEAREHLSR